MKGRVAMEERIERQIDLNESKVTYQHHTL
jgi:hypothetical protein